MESSLKNRTVLGEAIESFVGNLSQEASLIGREGLRLKDLVYWNRSNTGMYIAHASVFSEATIVHKSENPEYAELKQRVMKWFKYCSFS